jgi:protein O-mannosyl-transferase
MSHTLAIKESRNWAALICFLLAVGTLLVFWPVTRHEFVAYDDQEYVYENAIVRKGLTAHGFVWAWTHSHSANWHPLTWLSHMLDCELFGLKPAGHHLTNVFFHVTNSVLLFLLLRKLTGAMWRSAFVAALFALHPLHVESVAWVAERKDVLCAFFGLLSLASYANYARRINLGSRVDKRNYILALFWFALGLLSKPMLVTLPFVMLLLDYWPLERFQIGNARTFVPLIKEKIPFFCLSVATCALTLVTQERAMDYSRTLGFAARAANALVSYPRYLGKIFWPENLAVVYPHPGRWPISSVVMSALFLVALSLVAFYLAKRQPWFAMGWLWFVGMLIPVIGLVQVGVQSMADRYTYLPAVGVFIAVTWLIAEWAKSPARRATAASILSFIILACGGHTISQLRVWQNTETLFTHAAAVTSGNWVAHFNLADLAMRRHERRQLNVQVAKINDSANSSTNRDFLSEVLQHAREGLRHHPTMPGPRVLLAKALAERGQFDDAWAQSEIAMQLDPTNAEPHQIRGDILLQRGSAARAVQEYRRALELKPTWDAVLNNLAWILATHPDDKIRNGTEAVRFGNQACELAGYTNISFLLTLGAAHAEAQSFSNAVHVTEEARRLALNTGQSALAEVAIRRLELYRVGQPFRDRLSSR